MEETRQHRSLRAVPNDRTLHDWKNHWIHDETAIYCAQCLASQSVLDAQAPFVHHRGCGYAHPLFAHYPWQDLARILRADMLKELSRP
ncbi:hypothetical protein [Pseudomonas typographi]|uniref:Uncharacterized protein n=1 Tax=Pseudomonas typographi TaxID=2715964 RepID=A0ABR7Z6Z6_9PSED|nr:hypothetical protein [Pseudomonas typographi]MBD1553992.1 hypothetical protein [Pseudomonas typographi]MBD1589263.1 hypothetical protein [Pseudomonas typographi]MBD1601291.1 hypothetical protein [Pseudomonas typographi]